MGFVDDLNLVKLSEGHLSRKISRFKNEINWSSNLQRRIKIVFCFCEIIVELGLNSNYKSRL